MMLLGDALAGYRRLINHNEVLEFKGLLDFTGWKAPHPKWTFNSPLNGKSR